MPLEASGVFVQNYEFKARNKERSDNYSLLITISKLKFLRDTIGYYTKI